LVSADAAEWIADVVQERCKRARSYVDTAYLLVCVGLTYNIYSSRRQSGWRARFASKLGTAHMAKRPGDSRVRVAGAEVAEVEERGLGIRLRNIGVTFAHGGAEIRALAGVDLKIPGGAFVSMIGPSGCGKSTLLLVTAGLLKPTNGYVQIGGQPVTKPHEALGMVFQRDLLLEWRTVLGNVLLQVELRARSAKAYRDRAMELLDLVDLSGFAHRYPRELSGGMRQRVAICRALVHEPRILLMDEPFGAVDALTREQLNVDLAQLCHQFGATTIFVTHSIEEAVFLGDRVVIFSPRPGRVMEDMDIRLPRPRIEATRNTESFFEHMKQARAVLRQRGLE